MNIKKYSLETSGIKELHAFIPGSYKIDTLLPSEDTKNLYIRNNIPFFILDDVLHVRKSDSKRAERLFLSKNQR